MSLGVAIIGSGIFVKEQHLVRPNILIKSFQTPP
jgi:hypothetical protein